MSNENNHSEITLRYHHLMVAVLIVFAAFAIRAIAIYERAGADYFFIPQAGTDHHFYLETGKSILEGTFPSAPFLFHPGPSYTFAAFYTILGSDNFVVLTFVIALLDALTCGMLIGSAWVLTKRIWGGYITGIIYALYPVAIFYATTPLIAPLAAFFVSGFIFFTLWQREQIAFWRTIVIGIFAGLLAIHRLNLAPIAGLYGLLFFITPASWRDRFVHGMLFALIIAAIIAPFTYLNYQNSGGDFILIAKTGPAEIYMGNNRDSGGRHGTTFAHEHIDMGYQKALWRDARVAPEHFFGLFAYKFALFWSDLEPGNNLNFDTARKSSSMINLTPMRFSWLAIAGLLGLSFLWVQNRPVAIYLGSMLAWMCFGYVLVFAFGRIRFPAVVPLVLLSGVAITTIIQKIRSNTDWLGFVKQHSLMIVAIASTYIFMNWALFPEPKLPPERTYSELPADAVRIDAQFGEVTLVGWRVLDEEWDYLTNGWVPIFESYAVELFWEITQPTDTVYNFFLAYIDDSQRYDAIDTPIGTVSFPNNTTDKWRPNQILGEVISLRLDEDVPQAYSGQIRAGVWYWDEEGLINNVPLESGETNVLIQHIAMFNNARIPEPPDLPPVDITFGERIALKGYDLPETGTAGEIIAIPFYWEATQNITEDYRVFIHVLDDNGEIVTQADERPMSNLFTYNWMVGYPLTSSISLILPEQSGTYEIRAGLYNNSGRLPLDTTNDSVSLGIIDIIVE